METLEQLLASPARLKRALSWLDSREAALAASGGGLFYASCDLRRSGFKAAVVDLNIYPAGFNNLCPGSYERAAGLLRDYVAARLPGLAGGRVLVYPEFHRHNLPYVCHLAALVKILELAGFSAKVADQVAGLPEEACPPEAPFARLPLANVVREGDRLREKGGEDFAFVVLNNDLSAGLPTALEGLEQPVLPGPEHGWYRRSKARFCACYESLAAELCAAAELDPWLLVPESRLVMGCDLESASGREAAAAAVEEVLSSVRREYARRGLDERPRIFVKNDAGTYGMGILCVASGEEVLKLNHHGRDKMAMGKDRRPIRDLLVQEAVPTAVHVNGMPAEIVCYLCGGRPGGYFHRINGSRDENGNLNSPGMVFQALCGREATESPEFALYEIMARLASLAGAMENRGDQSR